MKINLIVEDYSDGLKPFATFLCKLKRQHKYLPLKAFIDTGSGTSNIAIPPLNKKRVNISSIIDSNYKDVMIGGAMHKGHLINIPIEFIFRTDDDQKVILKPHEIYVYMPYTDSKHNKKMSYSLPSIIGVDFLKQHNLSLYFNPSKKLAWLEKP